MNWSWLFVEYGVVTTDCGGLFGLLVSHSVGGGRLTRGTNVDVTAVAGVNGSKTIISDSILIGVYATLGYNVSSVVRVV